MLTLVNHGPLLVECSYWGSDHDLAGKLLVSCNAGAIRCLLPRSLWSLVPDLRKSRHAVLSRGPWPDEGLDEAAEILWEDGTDAPHAWHLSPDSFVSGLPAEPKPGQEWTISAWIERDGRPHRAIERRCFWRRVERIPCLRPWEAS